MCSIEAFFRTQVHSHKLAVTCIFVDRPEDGGLERIVADSEVPDEMELALRRVRELFVSLQPLCENCFHGLAFQRDSHSFLLGLGVSCCVELLPIVDAQRHVFNALYPLVRALGSCLNLPLELRCRASTDKRAEDTKPASLVWVGERGLLCDLHLQQRPFCVDLLKGFRACGLLKAEVVLVELLGVSVLGALGVLSILGFSFCPIMDACHRSELVSVDGA